MKGRILMEGEVTEKEGMRTRNGREKGSKEGKKGGGSPPFFPSCSPHAQVAWVS